MEFFKKKWAYDGNKSITASKCKICPHFLLGKKKRRTNCSSTDTFFSCGILFLYLEIRWIPVLILLASLPGRSPSKYFTERRQRNNSTWCFNLYWGFTVLMEKVGRFLWDSLKSWCELEKLANQILVINLQKECIAQCRKITFTMHSPVPTLGLAGWNIHIIKRMICLSLQIAILSRKTPFQKK